MRTTGFTKLIVSTLGCLTICAGAARADDVYVRSGKEAAELPFKNVTISKVKDGELYFALSTRESHRPIAEISRLELTGETQFNAAEKAFADARVAKDEAVAKTKFGESIGGYVATLGSTNKPWLKDYVAVRMQIAAPRSGRFDMALAGWKAMVEKNPAEALKAKPSVEGIEKTSQYLAAGAKDLLTAANGSSKPEAQKAYLELLEDVQTAMGDTDAAAKTMERRVTLGGTPEEVAEIGVKLALIDLANKKPDAAAERVGKVNLALLNDATRADATYVLAEAKAAKLPPTAPQDAWKDLAIEYMQVVAGFPNSPNAAPALLKVAEIHETLKEPETALKIYQQVVREHANTPAAQAAQKGVDRLGGKAAARG